MSLLFKRENLDGLDESLQALYEERDGAFFLKVQGAVAEDELQGIKANRDALLAEKKEQQRIAQEAEAERLRIEREAAEAKAKQTGDWEALDQSYKAQKEEILNKAKQREEELLQRVYKLTVGEQAVRIAAELVKPHAQALIVPLIEQRLMLDENHNVRVKSADGKPSPLTAEDLKAELRANPMLQDIIVISGATGGGATGGGFGGGAAKEAKDYTVAEMKQLRAENPALYEQLFPLK